MTTDKDGLATQQPEARASVGHESGPQLWDAGKLDAPNATGMIAEDGPKTARERAWLDEHPADSALTKFARVWEGDDNARR